MDETQRYKELDPAPNPLQQVLIILLFDRVIGWLLAILFVFSIVASVKLGRGLWSPLFTFGGTLLARELITRLCSVERIDRLLGLQTKSERI